ncbi:unnamed protein product [Owenia fusiformis]|uniref:Vitamin K-dependent gamma-carboxylase n=1 Tax=Owenia fusiformis TaxID=6347 RepID=A0A8S4PJN1_OWEFU|nr:unnamed protein product [Owenia fusiformis]
MARSKTDTAKNHTETKTSQPSWLRNLCGFDISDFTSWNAFVRLLHQPRDPASLAVMRILYGTLMCLDVIMERGLSYADVQWGDPDECRFPLFNFLHPLPLKWMYIVYLTMFTCSLGILLGFMYRICCVGFMLCYWYIFFLDKTSWNNHSYMFGLFAFVLCFMDANRCWSIDGIIWPKMRHSHVPLWNYTILRTQVFMVYFVAGLKKTEFDWVAGYSMVHLSKHWVFEPFRLVLTDDQIDLFVVHIGGFLLDISIGFVLFFDATRIYGFIFGGSFHLMNSQLFSIGMFPWTMIATMPLFCYTDWPRHLVKKLSKGHIDVTADPLEQSQHCLYDKEQIKSEEKSAEDNGATAGQSRILGPSRSGEYHKYMSMFVLFYITTQCILPYSHGITKGYNNWTNGLYGYSWDMMVHSWRNQHIRLTYVDNSNGEVGYLKPDGWTTTKRWSSHGDMLKQYAMCIQEKMTQYDLNNVSLYFDIWRSMNGRFQQRMFDPRVDMVTAQWHPLMDTSYLMPMLADLSDWRGKLKEIEDSLIEKTNDTDVVFVADFPGLYLENYVQPDLGNTSITVLHGEVKVTLVDDNNRNVTLTVNQSMQLPADAYHLVTTVSDTPSCYMYIFVNTTENQYIKNVTKFEDELSEGREDFNLTAALDEAEVEARKTDDQLTLAYCATIREREGFIQKAQKSTLQNIWLATKEFWLKKYFTFTRSIQMTWIAIRSIFNGTTFEYTQDILMPNDFIMESSIDYTT